MSYSRFRALTVLLLAALVLLSGCTETKQTGGDDYVEGHIVGEEIKAASQADDIFSLNSVPSAGFNPYTTEDEANRLVCELVYENIVNVDDSFGVSGRIISEANSNDGQYWYFKINTGIPMHDGEPLTAKDVSYSIQRAMVSPRYRGRFANVAGVTATDDSSMMMSLTYPDYQIMSMFTIPVIRYGSIKENAPAGSGPYKFSEDMSCLVAFDDYEKRDSLPVDTIGLVQYEGTENIISAYEDSYIDLVTNEPSSPTNLGYGGTNEIRSYISNNMHFIGFNMEKDFTGNSQIRYAMQYALNRKEDAEVLMQGHAVPSAIPINPNSPLFNKELNSKFSYNLDMAEQLFANAGVQDYDNDGKLEHMVTGIALEINLRFIVCSESGAKVDTAKQLAGDLTAMGITCTVDELDWDAYQYALGAGEFDMYYGEVRLTADFNTLRFFIEDGNLNYGKNEDPVYEEAVYAYLAADDFNRQQACDRMLETVTSGAPIIVVGFERQQVITHRGAVTGLSPSQYGVFYNIPDWTITFG